MPSPRVSSRLFAPALHIARLHQLDVTRLLDGLEVAPAELGDDQTHLPLQTFCRLLLRLGENLKQPHIGLLVGEATQPRMLGTVGFAMATAADLSQAYHCFVHYQSVLLEGLELAVCERDGRFEIQWTHQEPLDDVEQRYLDDWLMASLVNWPRWLSGAQVPLSLVETVNGEPINPKRYRQFFAADIRFASEANRLQMPASYFQRPCLEGHARMHQLHCEYADEQLAATQPQALSLKVKALIRQHLHDQHRPLRREDIAAQINMSLRSLQRKLSQQGTNFQALYDEARKSYATQQIESTATSLAALSYQLGFANQSAFQKAFKRWTGTSPRDFRQRIRLSQQAPHARPLAATPTDLAALLAQQTLSLSHFFPIALHLIDELETLHEQGERSPRLEPVAIALDGGLPKLQALTAPIAKLLWPEDAAPAISPDDDTSAESRLGDQQRLLSLLEHLLASTAPRRPESTAKALEDHTRAQLLASLRQLKKRRLADLQGLKSHLQFLALRYQHQQPIPAGDTLSLPQPLLPTLANPLYGRDQALSDLESWLASRSLALQVSGNAGSGVTTLMNAWRRRAARRSLPYVAGRYHAADQRPWSGIRELFSQLLSPWRTPARRTAARKDALFREPGLDIGVLTSLVADLGLPPGRKSASAAAPEPATPSSSEQLLVTLSAVLRSLSHRLDGLVLGLDGLQQADADSLKLLAELVTRCRALPVRWILAWSGEPRPEPLSDLLNVVEELSQAPCPQIRLQPLTSDTHQRMLEELMPADQEGLPLLLAQTDKQTGGRADQALNYWRSLARQGLLRYRADLDSWTRAELQTQAANATAAHGTERLDGLSDNSRLLLGVAACLGERFELGALAALCDQPLAACSLALWPAQLAGLIQAVAGGSGDEQTYRFPTSSELETCRALLPTGQQARWSWRAGWRAIRAMRLDDDRLFTTLRQLNSVCEQADPQQRSRLWRLNRVAARRAKRISAFSMARELLQAACQLLPGEALAATEVPLNSALSQLWLERIDAEILADRHGSALQLAERVYPRLPDQATRARLRLLQGRHLLIQGDATAALTWLSQGLKDAGLQLPDAGAIDSVLYARLNMIERQPLPKQPTALMPAASKQQRLQLALLQELSQAAQLCRQQSLHAWALVEMAWLALRTAPNRHSAFAFASFAFLSNWLFGHQEVAARYRHLCERLCTASGATQQARARQVVAGQVAPWQSPLSEVMRLLLDSHRQALQVGDWLGAGYTQLEMDALQLRGTTPLSEQARRAKSASRLLEKLGLNQLNGAYRAGVVTAIDRLQGRETTPLEPGEEGHIWAWIWATRLPATFVLEELENWPLLIAREREIESHLPGHYQVAESLWLTGLMRLRLLEQVPARQKAIWQRDLEHLEIRLEHWMRQQPDNFSHLHALIKAERAALDARLNEAMETFEQAIAHAERQQLPMHQAIAAEAYSRFWSAQGRVRFARLYLNDALRFYQDWGASAKVEQLRLTARRLDSA